jgi:hypothetical protein
MDLSELPGFNHLKHEQYVSLGYCLSVNPVSRAYCCQQQGHGGEHWSLDLHPDMTISIGTRWD